MKAQSDCSKGIWMRVGLEKMISITMVIRTEFTLMLSMVLSDATMLLDPKNQDDYVWADSVNPGEHFKDLLNLGGFENRIHEKGSRNHPLSAVATDRNSIRSQIRDPIEHVFGCLATSVRDKFTKKLGLKGIKLGGA